MVSPVDAVNQNVIFSSSDQSIATVSPTGLVTGVSEGDVMITVTTEEGDFTDTIILPILAPSSRLNWASFQPTTGTGTPDGSNVVANLTDDNTNTRWSVQGFPQSATVDLNGNCTITQTEVTCYEDRAYQFILEGSLTEDGPFTTIVDRSNNTSPGTATTPIINSVDSIVARFVRITVTGANVYTGPWSSLTELRVFGEGERDPVSADDVTADNMVQLFPNPVTSTLSIQTTDNFEAVTVYDLAGREVFRRSLRGTTGTLDVSELKSGHYILRIESNSKLLVSRFVKL